MRHETGLDGAIAVSADGMYQTEPVTLQTPGFYSYREWIDEGGFVRATRTKCAEVAETTVIIASAAGAHEDQRPDDATRCSHHGQRVVTGLGALAVTVKVALFGPFASHSAINCTGKPYWRGHVLRPRRRHIRDGAGHDRQGRLLHVSGDDRRQPCEPLDRDGMRRDGRDDSRHRGSCRDDDRLQ